MGGRTNEATHECLGQKYKSSYLRVDRQTKPPISALYKSSYLWVDGQTKPLMSALVKNLSPSMGGWTNQATHECLGQSISLPTYGWTNELSHLRVPW